MRIAITLALIATGLTFFVSCGPRGQSAPSDTTHTPIQSQGTADSGGGNTFQGKPLESYKINPRDLSVYKTFIAPWLDSETLKRTSIGNALASVLDKKIWYLIPSELKKLSAEKIGSAVGADQVALQDLKQVWLNSLLFEKMESSDQAVLIVHELLMGLKIFKLDSPLSECLAFQPISSESDPQYCHNSFSKEIRGKLSDLTQNDYAQIRTAAALLSERGPKLNLKELEDILGSQGFINIPAKKTISLEQLAQMLESSKLMKSWPTFGFNLGKIFEENPNLLSPENRTSAKLSSDVKCNYEIQINKDNFAITFLDGEKNVTYSSEWTSPIEMQLVEDSSIGFSLYTANFSRLKSSEVAAKGDVVVDFSLKFLGETLLGVTYNKNVCLNNDCSTAGQGLNGENVLCYTRSSITFSANKK